MKVLIVDDESLDLFISKKILSFQYEVSGFTSVDEAIGWAKENTFEAVLVDYYLTAGVTAGQVLKQLTSVKPKSYKAFVLSSFVGDEQIKELKKLGFDDVILKPLTIERFQEAIAK
ncbi:response regulator [Fulvivirgaceae bacterium PWU20]|uniref:Response regulator n=1 Tax=Chryseosolibacter indicus TaxID=2782351 RepID=A0ABS5VV09_9BACT|nr:response regulator [Chryseosolibacter indicus]